MDGKESQRFLDIDGEGSNMDADGVGRRHHQMNEQEPA
jgi:hypothetical protein